MSRYETFEAANLRARNFQQKNRDAWIAFETEDGISVRPFGPIFEEQVMAELKRCITNNMDSFRDFFAKYKKPGQPVYTYEQVTWAHMFRHFNQTTVTQKAWEKAKKVYPGARPATDEDIRTFNARMKSILKI